MANYNFVIDSHFKPFSFQEMVAPYMIYKDAYEKAEEKYHSMVDRANVFKYLSETLPEKSKARMIYEGFAKDLEEKTRDFLENGLTMGTRSSLTSLRGRIQGEIGQLEKADEKYREDMKVRDSLLASGKQILYANENPTIDDYLPGRKPNKYGISTDALYAAGFDAAKSASARKYWAGDAGSVMGYYRDWVQRQGYDEATLSQFESEIREKFIHEAVTTLPGLQRSLRSILKSEGVLDNLKGNNLSRAFEATLRGMINGAIYQEQHSPQRDLGTISAEAAAGFAREDARLAFQKEEAKLSRLMQGFDENGKYLGVENDPTYQRQSKIQEEKYKWIQQNKNNSNTSGGKSSTTRGTRLKSSLKARWRIADGSFKDARYIDVNSKQGDDFSKLVGEPVAYDKLDKMEKEFVDHLNIDPTVHTYSRYKDEDGHYRSLQIDPLETPVTTGLEGVSDVLNAIIGDPNKVPEE